jgi:hypothetical protein
MVRQSASSGDVCKCQCMLQYGVHKLGLPCNKLFPPEMHATVSVHVTVGIWAQKTLNYYGIKYFLRGCLQVSVHTAVVPTNWDYCAIKYFLRGCLQVSVHAVVHMCASFKPVHLNYNRLVTAVTSTCCSFCGD